MACASRIIRTWIVPENALRQYILDARSSEVRTRAPASPSAATTSKREPSLDQRSSDFRRATADAGLVNTLHVGVEAMREAALAIEN